MINNKVTLLNTSKQRTCWKRAPLKELCRIVSGSTPSSSVMEFWNGEIVWVTPTDLGKLQGYQIETSARRITKAGNQASNTEICPVGSVVLSTRAPIGYLGIAAVELCTNQGCKTLVPGVGVDSTFLYFALRRVVPELQARGSGATFAELSKTQLENYEIDFPPLAEQKRIAAILTEQMAAVEKARVATEAQLESARALPASYLYSVFNSSEAKKWPIKKLGEVSEFNPTRPLIKRSDNMPTTFIPMAAVDEAGRGVTKAKLRPFGEIKKGYTYFGESDVLFAKITPCMQNGKHAIVKNLTDGIGFGSTEFHVIRPVQEIISEWIHYFVIQSYILENAVAYFTGTVGQQRVPESYLSNLGISLPALSEQKRVVAMLADKILSAEKIINQLQEQLETINKMPAALLRKAFSGRL